ncbi:MAG: hypothetical protein K2N95_00395 [Lachnospiraceae bacterium]|nr:hypothetical protein [Lachnospiraceae bacterium]
MKDCLKPHRDLEAEVQLKTIIQQIQSLMDEPKNDSAVENLLIEASKYIKASDRVLDLTVIEHYEDWTDIDGIVGELTMEVPVLQAVSKEDFLSIVQEIREVIESGQAPDNMRLDYWMNFYRELFALNFPNAENVDLLDAIFEDTSLDDMIEVAFPHT